MLGNSPILLHAPIELGQDGRLARCRHEYGPGVGIINVLPQLLVTAILDQTPISMIMLGTRATTELSHGLLVLRQENVELVGLVDGEIAVVRSLIVATIVRSS